MALTDKLRSIADAIREKTGKTDPLTLDQMPGEISGIESGGGAEDLDAELAEQEALIDQLRDTLRGKAGGGGGEPMEMIATFADGTTKTYIIYGEVAE